MWICVSSVILQEADRPGVLPVTRSVALWEPVLRRPGVPSARANGDGRGSGPRAQDRPDRCGLELTSVSSLGLITSSFTLHSIVLTLHRSMIDFVL